jgi:hypothetical protein
VHCWREDQASCRRIRKAMVSDETNPRCLIPRTNPRTSRPILRQSPSPNRCRCPASRPFGSICECCRLRRILDALEMAHPEHRFGDASEELVPMGSRIMSDHEQRHRAVQIRRKCICVDFEVEVGRNSSGILGSGIRLKGFERR